MLLCRLVPLCIAAASAPLRPWRATTHQHQRRTIFRGGTSSPPYSPPPADGQHTAEALHAPQQLAEQTWPALELYEDGTSRETELSWRELRERISSSDARLLLRTKAFDLAIRDDCVVFDFGFLRGYTDGKCAVLLLVDERSRGLALNVEKAVERARVRPEYKSGSFALMVLEGVLEEAYESTFKRLERLDIDIRRELAGLADLRHGAETTRGASLYRLLPLETELRDFAVKGRRFYSLLADALRDDVFVQHNQHLLFGKNRTARRVELAEAVFENSLCQWEFVNDAIEQLAGTIEATRKLVELALDNERNRLERMDIHLNIAALGLGLVSAIGGIFGMNLLIGLETAPYWFNRVVVLTCLSASFLCHLCWRQFYAQYRQHANHVHDVVSLLHGTTTQY